MAARKMKKRGKVGPARRKPGQKAASTAVRPQEPEQVSNLAGELEASLIGLAVEGWRFARSLSRIIPKLGADGTRVESQVRYYLKRIDDSLGNHALTVVNLEGQPFEPGMAASALNLGDFGPEDGLTVDQVIEPVIMSATGVRRPGTVLLRRATP